MINKEVLLYSTQIRGAGELPGGVAMVSGQIMGIF